MARDISKHPCFNGEVKRKYGRIHLPVAPKCNVQCNFCNRKYDCVNESRPGVASAILSPKQALFYLTKMYERDNRLSVVGIAGPGDTFANPEESLETMSLVRRDFPEMLLCVSTNGLAAPVHIDRLAEIGITHLTVTVNAVGAEIGSKIYAWVRDGISIYRGVDAAELLMQRQFETIRRCHEKGIVVKINSILIPGINDNHITEVAKTVSQLGADLFNCIPMFPVAGTAFESIPPPPDSGLIDSIRADCKKYLPQMLHCTRCRADAVGCLGDKVPTSSIKLLQTVAAGPLDPLENRPYIAVASHEGLLVNEHLGRARHLWIYGRNGDDFKLIETRQTPPGGGDIRWRQLAGLLRDCKAVLVSAAGPKPTEALTKSGVKVIVVEAVIEQVLRSLYDGEDLDKYKPRSARCCSGGAGCA